MKKIYSKPEIAFESFTLNTNIAGDCEVKIDTFRANQCGITWGTDVLFFSGMSVCVEPVETDGENGLCYDIPTPSTALFNS